MECRAKSGTGYDLPQNGRREECPCPQAKDAFAQQVLVEDGDNNGRVQGAALLLGVDEEDAARELAQHLRAILFAEELDQLRRFLHARSSMLVPFRPNVLSVRRRQKWNSMWSFSVSVS